MRENISVLTTRRHPLAFLRPKVSIFTTSRREHTARPDVRVGLMGHERFKFPFGFQGKFDRAFPVAGSVVVNLPVEPSLRIDGEAVSSVTIEGLSEYAAAGSGLVEVDGLDSSLREVARVRYGKNMPELNAGYQSSEQIFQMLTLLNCILLVEGVDSSYPRASQMEQGYFNFCPLLLTRQPSLLLFRLAHNRFRGKQMARLMARAHEVFPAGRKDAVSQLVVADFTSRRHGAQFDFYGGGATEIEGRDRALRQKLVEGIARARKDFDQAQWEREAKDRLELFLRGSAYLETERFFYGLADRIGTGGEIFRLLPKYFALYVEDLSTKAMLAEESLWPASDPFVSKMMQVDDYLPYQGARVIEAFEAANGARLSVEDLVHLQPFPYDLMPAIDALSAPSD